MLKWHHNRGDFIFAKHLGDEHDFSVPDGSVFGDTPVYHYTAIRPLEDEIFVFKPTSMEWLKEGHFLEGQEVNLIINTEVIRD